MAGWQHINASRRVNTSERARKESAQPARAEFTGTHQHSLFRFRVARSSDMRNSVAMNSLPALFARVHGIDCTGEEHCFFCGAACDRSNSTADYVRDSFTNRDSVARPGSQFVCAGCVLCMRESADCPYHTGEMRYVNKAAMRMHSWIVGDGKAVAASKAHFPYLRSVLLVPPSPPWAISIAVSGQKHVLYRGVVNHDVGECTVTLEGERVTYHPDQLCERLVLCAKICAASGKPALTEPPTARLGMAVVGRYRNGDELITQWASVWSDPLSRLCAFVGPNKEESELEYPSS